MSRLILYHEYRKLAATVFCRKPEAQSIDPQDLPEMKELLTGRADGFNTVPPPPKDFSVFWDMSEKERFNAGLMIWVEGTGWQMWMVPFEWRHALVDHKEAENAFLFPNGMPFRISKWKPDTVNPMFGMAGVGPIVGNFLHYMVESHGVMTAIHAAGNTERYPEVRGALENIGSSAECLKGLDDLHNYLLGHTQSV